MATLGTNRPSWCALDDRQGSRERPRRRSSRL